VYTSGTNKKNTFIPITVFRKIKFRKEKLSIRFNLQSSNETIHNQLTRNPHSFKNVLHSIRNAQDAGIKTEIHIIPLKTNQEDIPKLLNLAKVLNVDKIKILRFIPQGRGAFNQDMELTTDELKQFIRKVQINHKKILFKNVKMDIGKSLQFGCKNCLAGLKKHSIDYNYNYHPCAAMKTSSIFTFKINSFKDVFQQENQKILLKKLNDYKKKMKENSNEGFEDCIGLFLLRKSR
jgi:MoaA/NifB/PqqE/SkfB family radical SAM enzyme